VLLLLNSRSNHLSLVCFTIFQGRMLWPPGLQFVMVRLFPCPMIFLYLLHFPSLSLPCPTCLWPCSMPSWVLLVLLLLHGIFKCLGTNPRNCPYCRCTNNNVIVKRLLFGSDEMAHDQQEIPTAMRLKRNLCCSMSPKLRLPMSTGHDSDCKLQLPDV
jgi:hypothetical protein